MGALADCASSTRRMICASVVSLPTRTARMTSSPVWFTVPPMSLSPTCFATGSGSPVTIDSSTDDVPDATTPSVGTVAPGKIYVRRFEQQRGPLDGTKAHTDSDNTQRTHRQKYNTTST